MPSYEITNCTVHDAAAIAANNMSAFWQDPNWRMLWRHTTLPNVITQASARGARNLLRDRDALRHFKAVDSSTGKLVGYIRWKLPAGHREDEVGRAVWQEGQTPDVSDGERKRFEEMAAAASWEIDRSSDVLDEPFSRARQDFLAKKEYLELDYFAVHPDEQGKGVGSALLEHGIRKAQELRLDIFVLSFVGGFKIYEHRGFKLLDSMVQDATPYGGNSQYAVQYMELEAKR